MNTNDKNLFDAGLFIGALLQDDPRHTEARPLVEAARKGEIPVCTTTGILSEVYAALTWIGAQPPHSPNEASIAVRLLVEPPSEIYVLTAGLEVALKMLKLSEKYELKARRVHDARHAAIAIKTNISSVYTYDPDDWKIFEPEGLIITGPNSVCKELCRISS